MESGAQYVISHGIIPRVNNKEGKRVSNALYTPCNMFSASNVTCSRAHVTSPRG